MEYNLCGTENIQSAVGIDGTIRTEGLHHRLLIRNRVIGMLHDGITFCHHTVHIAFFRSRCGTKISLIVRSNRTERSPVIFRMNQDLVVFCHMKIQNSRKDFIFYFDQAHGFFHAGFIFSGNDRHRITYKTHMLIQNQTIVRSCLWIGLSCRSKTLLRYIFPGINRFNSRYFLRCCFIDFFYDCICMGAAQ